MNRDDIARMAREAGLFVDAANGGVWAVPLTSDLDERIFRFGSACEAFGAAAERDANLQQIEIIVEAAVAAEREACAKVCVDLVLAFAGRADLTALQCAEAIRARGDK